jgi:hypothetical protein
MEKQRHRYRSTDQLVTRKGLSCLSVTDSTLDSVVQRAIGLATGVLHSGNEFVNDDTVSGHITR